MRDDACGYIVRNIQRKCPELSEFTDGYDYAIEDAIAWLKENANKYIVDLGIGYEQHNFVVGGMCWVNMENELSNLV
jgi:hypothetical protein